jgi:hypothetical protein
MSGWLRAHGSEIRWPSGVTQATDTLTSQLDKRGKMSLAKQLRASVSATLATPFKGSAKPSVQLLDLVDVVEKELR